MGIQYFYPQKESLQQFVFKSMDAQIANVHLFVGKDCYIRKDIDKSHIYSSIALIITYCTLILFEVFYHKIFCY
jgi:hypothetical protein